MTSKTYKTLSFLTHFWFQYFLVGKAFAPTEMDQIESTWKVQANIEIDIYWVFDFKYLIKFIYDLAWIRALKL